MHANVLLIFVVIGLTVPASAEQVLHMGPRPTFAETTLVRDGQAQCIIVHPGGAEYEAVGQRIAEVIEAKTGAAVTMLSSVAVTDRPFHLADEHRGSQLIVLGQVHNNTAHLALYANLHAMADAEWPGESGFELRTACNPFGTGRNAIVLGASNLAGVQAAAAMMIERLAELPDGPTLTLPRWCTVVIDGKDQAEIDPQTYPTPEGTRGGQSNFNRAWLDYQRTGHAAALEYLTRCMHWLADGESGWEHYWGTVLIDPLEMCANFGLVDGPTLERIDNWLLDAVEKGRDYSLALGSRAGNYGNRHQTYGTYGYYRSWRYLLRGAPNTVARRHLEPLVEGTRAYLDSLLDAYRDDPEDQPSFNSNAIFVRFAAGEGRFDFWTSGRGRLMAWRELFFRDNLGHFCGSGGAGWVAPELRGGIAVANGVAAAAFFDGDAELASFGYRGDFDWTVAVPRWKAGPDVAPRPPASLLGARVLPISRPHWDRRRPGAGVELSYEQSFDKLVFRDGFDRADAYLVVQGSDSGSDANAIVRYTDRGQIWLMQNQKSQNHFYRNAVYVSRGVDDRPPPAFARLAAVENFGDVAVSSTVLENYHGVDWQRNIIHRRGEYFVVIDVCRAGEAGRYAMSCIWRSPSAGALADGTWTIRGGVSDFVLRGEPGAAATLTAIKDRPFAEFEQGAGFMVRQDRSGAKQAGEVTTFRNVFYATGPGDEQRYEMRAVSDRAVMVRGDRQVEGRDGEREMALIGVGAFAGDEIRVDGDVFYVSVRGSHIVNEREADVPAAAKLGDALERLWESSGEGQREVESHESEVAWQAVDPVWRNEVTLTRPRPIRSVSATGDRSFNSGQPDDLVDGQLPMYFNLTTSIAPQTQITFDLSRPIDIAELDLRFISTMSAWQHVRVELSDDGFVDDVRPLEVSGQGGDYYQLPWSAYDYALFEGCTIPVGQRARYVRFEVLKPDGGGEVIFRESGTRQARPRSLQVADLDGDGDPEIIVATEFEELAVFSAGGERLWSHPLTGWITRVLVADLEDDSRQEIIVSTFDSRLYAFEADGSERFAWHRQVTASEFGSVGLWKRDADGRAQIVGPGYVDFTMLDADGQKVAGPETGGVRTDGALAEGTDLTGDGVDDQVIHGFFTNNLFILDGQAMAQGKTIAAPIGAALGVELIGEGRGRGRDGDGRDLKVLCVTSGGVLMAKVVDVEAGAGGPVVDASGLGRASVSDATREMATQWSYPIGPVNAYVVVDDAAGRPRIVVAKRDGMLIMFDGDGRLVGSAQMGGSVRGLAATGRGDGVRLAVATQRGVQVLDGQLKVVVRMELADCAAVGWLDDRRVVAMSDDGRIVGVDVER